MNNLQNSFLGSVWGPFWTFIFHYYNSLFRSFKPRITQEILGNKVKYAKQVGGFKYFWNFSPLKWNLGKMKPILTSIFSKRGLVQPPTNRKQKTTGLGPGSWGWNHPSGSDHLCQGRFPCQSNESTTSLLGRRERAQKYRLGVRHVEDGKYIHYMYNLYNNHIYLYGRCIYIYMYIYNIFWAEIILVEEISSNTLACAMSSAPVLSWLFHPRFVVFLLLVPDNSGCSVYIVKMVGKNRDVS